MTTDTKPKTYTLKCGAVLELNTLSRSRLRGWWANRPELPPHIDKDGRANYGHPDYNDALDRQETADGMAYRKFILASGIKAVLSVPKGVMGLDSPEFLEAAIDEGYDINTERGKRYAWFKIVGESAEPIRYVPNTDTETKDVLPELPVYEWIEVQNAILKTAGELLAEDVEKK